MKLYDIPPDLVTSVWPTVAPMLARALVYHPHLSPDDLRNLLLAQFAQLIIMTDGEKIIAAQVLERVRYPAHTVANVLAFAGERGVLANHVDEFVQHTETWSRARGCDTIAFVGRPGWQRFVLRRGGNMVPLVHAWRRLE